MKLGTIVATMEDLGQEPLSDMEMVENQTELVEGKTLIDQTERAVVGLDAAISAGDEAYDVLTNVQGVIPEGEASDKLLAVVESLCTHIHYVLGVPRSQLTMESFKGRETSLIVASLEDRKEGILHKLFMALKEMAKKVYEFIMGLFNNAKLIEKRLLALIKKTNDLKDSPVTGGEVSSGFPNFDAAGQAMKAVYELINVANDRARNIKNAIRALRTDDVTGMERSLRGVMDYDELSPNILMAGGGKLDISGVGSAGGATTEGAFKLSVTAPDEPVTKGERLTNEQCYDLLRTALRVLRNLMEMNKGGGIVTHTFRSLIERFGQFYNEIHAAKLATDDPRTLMLNTRGVAYKWIRAMRAELRELGVSVPKIAITNIKAVMTYAENSLSASKGSEGGSQKGPFSNLQN